MDKSKLRVLVVVNANASRAEAALPALSSWFAENCCSRMVVTASNEESSRKLEAHGRDADLIVIGGGDGTISKAVPKLLELERPFAVLPLGTANDFARTIGLPPDPLQAAKVALSGREHRIDVGVVNDRPYLNVASVGVASKVAKGQSKDMKRRWRVFAYAIALLQAVRSLQPFFVKLELDGKPAWSGPVYQVSVGNGRFHGGGLTVAEHAVIDDGKTRPLPRLSRPVLATRCVPIASQVSPKEARHIEAIERYHGVLAYRSSEIGRCRWRAGGANAGNVPRMARGADSDGTPEVAA